MKLQDKVIIVTGGGNGIGKALCERFQQEAPAAVIVSDIDAVSAEQVAHAIGGHAVACDVANESQIRDLITTTEAQFGRVDVFCANAGIVSRGGAEADHASWQRTMDVNFMSHVYSARAVLPGMLKRKSGYLLHTASAAGLLTQIGSAPYAVSKHAAVAFAEWLSITHGDQGILVSCLCPMGVWTEMLNDDDPAVKALHADAMQPSDVAEAVVQGMEEERFLILPHKEVERFFRNKSRDYDGWIGKLRKNAAQLSSPDVITKDSEP